MQTGYTRTYVRQEDEVKEKSAPAPCVRRWLHDEVTLDRVATDAIRLDCHGTTFGDQPFHGASARQRTGTNPGDRWYC